MLEKITPLVLTYNEAPNIKRTLQQLTWAKIIVVVDSYSTDETLEILKSHPKFKYLNENLILMQHNGIMAYSK